MKFLIYIQAIIVVVSVFITYFVLNATSIMPDSDFIKSMEPEQSTQVFDRNGKLIAEINKDENRICVPYEDISPYAINAVIAIEDIRFYHHRGIDPIGTLRAFLNNYSGGGAVQGGSTITQQLVKNMYLMPEKSIKRKLLEALLAAKVETMLSKHQIIEKYLNLIYLGNRSYGIEKAANKYFNKRAKDLSLGEAAFIAGLIKAPEYYSPYKHLKRALNRQKTVLDKMYGSGFITEEERKYALSTPLKFKQPQLTAFNKYPYFVDYVAYLLKQKYGEEVVERGGLKVYTTLDPVAQQIAEKTIKEGVKKLSPYTRIRQGALVTIDVKTGYIKAIVGGVDYSKSEFNRATMAHRATGSGFKPVIYLTGLRLGLITPNSIILDGPVSYRTKWNVWRPRNWDGKYMGKMTVRKALTLSRNTPTVRVALASGIDKVIETARLLGIRSHMDRGYSIVLGSAGITPVEIATMYSTLARDGVYIEPEAIRYITDSRGNVIESNKHKPVRVIDSKYVEQLNSILIDVVEKGTGKNARLPGRQVAGKTGTTDEFKDIWFSGFTPDTVTTIWLGNDENESLHNVFSSNCATLWKNFSEEYYKKTKIIAENFTLPAGETREAPKKEEVTVEKPKPKKFVQPKPKYTQPLQPQPRPQPQYYYQYPQRYYQQPQQQYYHYQQPQ